MRLIRILLALIVVTGTLAALVVLLMEPAGTDAGSVWHSIEPSSLNLVQAVTQRYIHPALWSRVIMPVLLQPAVGVFLATAGIALLLLLASLLWRRRGTK